MTTGIFIGSNINLVKRHNLQAILLSLLHDECVSRVELAEKTSLSTTTITNLTGELINNGIIAEIPNQETNLRRKVGRPRSNLKLVPSARYAVGVHIGVGLYRVMISNLFAENQTGSMAEFDLNTPAEEVILDIARLVDSTIADSGVERDQLVGVGLGASGLVDRALGTNVLAPRLNWENVPIRQILEDELELDVCVENNVRTMALGEAYFGKGRDVDVLAFVYGRIGVGAGFVVNGRLFRGSGAGAGEIGHTTMITTDGELCQCGKRGCLETLVSENVLLRDASLLAESHPDGILADLLEENGSGMMVESIFDAARQGDTAIRELIEEQSHYLGIALANLVNILNPDKIVLGGMFAQGADLIIPIAEKTMRSHSFARLADGIHLETTSFGWKAGVTGAASLALINFFYMPAEGA
jgi:predicted NBD/HSP70 family sugar kinase